MRLLSSMVLCVFALALLAMPAFAAKGEKGTKALRVVGEITKVEDKAVTITATSKAGDKTETVLTIDDTTKIKKDGAEAKAADLKVGDKAMATYDEAKKALTITVGKAKKSKE